MCHRQDNIYGALGLYHTGSRNRLAVQRSGRQVGHAKRLSEQLKVVLALGAGEVELAQFFVQRHFGHQLVDESVHRGVGFGGR